MTIANGAGAGAANLGSMDLTRTTGWNGFSSIAGGTISGNLTGNLELQQDSNGAGGDISGAFIVEQNVSGAIIVPVISGGLTISGNLSGNLTVTGRIDDSTVLINGDVDSKGTIDIADMVTQAVELTNPPITIQGDLKGTLVLQSGIGEHLPVFIGGELSVTGSIDLKGQGIAGQLAIHEGGGGSILNGGAVTGGETQTVVLVCAGLAYAFSGQATFSSVGSFGVIVTEKGHISGRITVTGDMDGIIGPRIGDLTSTSRVTVGGNLGGAILTSAGMDNELIANGDLAGDIVVGGLTGAINIVGTMSGDIEVKTDVGPSAYLQVGGRLERGRVFIAGVCDGDISVGEGAGKLSLIHLLGGLGVDGSVTINANQGDFDADGTIYVGPTKWTQMPPVNFDGCIHVIAGPPGSGDLNGDITVVGCSAAPGAVLNICIDGDVNGKVTIEHSGCQYFATWDCVGPCP